MPSPLRYAVAACQPDLPAPRDRAGIAGSVRHLLGMIDRAVIGYAPFAPVKLVVLPEYAHAAPVYFTAAEMNEHLALPIPNEHTDAYAAKAKQHDLHVLAGTFLERDERWPGHVFNTACLIGPQGIVLRYRKVHPWLPWEVHTSPHDLPGSVPALFPVAETPLGRIGVAIGSEWMFPEAVRQLALNGAEVLLRPAACMDPWGTPPMDWWALTNRCRAVENLACVVACNQGATGKNQPPYSWPGGSMVVDHDGRILAQADPGPGEKTVVAVLDIDALRHERATRRGHHFLAQLRTEAYAGYGKPIYPASLSVPGVQESDQAIEMTKRRLRG